MAILKRVGPLALTTVLTTNVYNQSSALIYDIVRMMHVVNHTDVDATFSLWLGATGANAAGTEMFSKQTVKARGIFDWPYPFKMLSTDFLVGGADLAATTLSLILTTDQVVV